MEMEQYIDHETETIFEAMGAENPLSTMSSIEQVHKCWTEYLEFGQDSVLRLCCDLDEPSVEYLLDALVQPNQHKPSLLETESEEQDDRGRCCDRIEELELDLCTFRDDNSVKLLTKLMKSLPRLRHVEVENRLLETPWDAWTVSTFLEHGGLHRLDKLVLYGVDLCGAQIGTSLQRLLLTAPKSEVNLTELMICFCHLDRAMMESFCQGLRHNSRLKKLTLYEGSIDDDMLGILVQNGLASCSPSSSNMSNNNQMCTTHKQRFFNDAEIPLRHLHTLNLGRNQLTSQSLRSLAKLLRSQSSLEFLSLSHNVELFRVTNDQTNEDTTQEFDPDECDEEPIVTFSSDGLVQRASADKSPQTVFWTALYQHTKLQTFWAQSPVRETGVSSTRAEQRAESILVRNLWLKRVTSSLLPFALWPRALVACSSPSELKDAQSIHQKTLVFAFLRFRVEAWMTLHGTPDLSLNSQKIKSL